MRAVRCGRLIILMAEVRPEKPHPLFRTRRLRAALAEGGGVEVDTQGDAFGAVALAQRALATHTWPTRIESSCGNARGQNMGLEAADRHAADAERLGGIIGKLLRDVLGDLSLSAEQQRRTDHRPAPPDADVTRTDGCQERKTLCGGRIVRVVDSPLGAADTRTATTEAIASTRAAIADTRVSQTPRRRTPTQVAACMITSLQGYHRPMPARTEKRPICKLSTTRIA